MEESRNYRQWWFQTCTELGYFQNAPAHGSIRSYIVNMTYHRNHCKAVFGRVLKGISAQSPNLFNCRNFIWFYLQDLWPDTNATNAYYGGNHIAATKVFFANGSQDPWKHASIFSLRNSWHLSKIGVMTSLSATEPALVITCHNCGHGVDVRGYLKTNKT